jgi:hypothetical protein
MVKGADLVFLPPTSPVFEFFCGLGDCLFADLDIHEALPSGFLYFGSVKFAARYHRNIAQSAGVSSSGCGIPL